MPRKHRLTPKQSLALAFGRFVRQHQLHPHDILPITPERAEQLKQQEEREKKGLELCWNCGAERAIDPSRCPHCSAGCVPF